ncbi:MAG: DNA-binding protein [Cellvibrionales bacterium]|nr:DNA-binding protein [Cellvibrionales bacterium]
MMARSGINKTLVEKAKNAIVSRGENPSIDRVRIELGNTGSKATIHRYLKEIEEEEGASVDKKSFLSCEIEELVSTLAAKLHEESSQIVIDNDAAHAKKLVN